MVFLWLNLASGLIILFIFLLIIILDHKNFRSDLQNIKSIVLAAILVAIAVALNTITKVFLHSVIFEIKLGNFALVLIGFFAGGALGFLAGIAADFLGLIIFSSGATILFFTLTSILWCILPYYLVRLLSKIYTSKWTTYFYLVLTYAFTLLLITGINPIVLKYMYNLNDGWWVLYLPRIIKYPLDLTVNGLALVVVYRIFTNSISLNTKIYQPERKKDKNLNLQIEQEGDMND
ncbi:folate family ECF transporter S component [Spiroplasma platyhelix]|uniref:Folate family ECF transporter S component n=1 Tax=Spiroplasma platyhelix PALS-1 TaxID=1276218 RepID=A0A846TWG0_9MOLU|nr:folate family ECF transporter S component [Spiroplasma platyhelix]MBE4704141.1 hypothetical protein [Spiroplasma platyhelix PALS-1]NKE38512.1 folate family ECF transporter S component [Spiroplasma platyhelix PALS-1]UJB29399.1 hypothetical protein SPLAT_v1c06350 [Spiroplasma platyhelix PALS-1]